jgi:hypothetical protein
VGICATGFAAIHIASPAWSGGLYSLSILAMLTSLLGVYYRRGRKRVFWVGFALFGWAHLFLAGVPWFNSWGGPGPQLFGAKLFAELFPRVHPESVNTPMNMGGMGMGGMGGVGGMGGGFRQMALGGPPAAPGRRFVQRADFLWIGQSLEALLWGVLGGWTATYLASNRGSNEGGGSDLAEAGPGPSA